ncbi:Macrolide-specific efflux protein macA precursor [Blautia wexlerae]|uniref:Macrolide-specific efflux protein macA n=1 Tax=Blautia wexlerae TaxID=418240 RepID=A0A173XZY8_9FIRM|nr:efflux RND transporter periplasmic adaptor subunit [Blautia wexlerae]RHG53960.1 efflux RND transporter periplasmic adaptor subunit [Ruminococcus sp. AM22-13]RHQ96881.1 efflux RND transporter periplasmic adaptor subunit [Ruminococcus sp. AF21-3]CUN56566.1 Macrolide-specific efflux protein macA precursor [Blautia wexlerae]
MKKKKSKKKIIIGAAAVLVVAGGVTVAGQRNSKDTQIPQVPVVTAEMGEVEEIVDATGTVGSEEEKTYYSPVNAELKTVSFSQGDVIKKGTKLIEFNTEDLEKDNQKAELNLKSTKYDTKDTRNKSDKAEKKQKDAKKNVQELEKKIKDKKAYVASLKSQISVATAAAQREAAAQASAQAAAQAQAQQQEAQAKAQAEAKKQQEIQRKYQAALNTYKTETLPQYQQKLSELNSQYNQAQSTYNQADTAYQMAFATWQADPSDENIQALNAAETSRTQAQIAMQQAKQAYEDYKQQTPQMPDLADFTQNSSGSLEEFTDGTEDDTSEEDTASGDYAYSGSDSSAVTADTSALESALESASDELAELQSDLASEKAIAEADSTSLTKEEKEKLKVTDNLSELDAKSAKELVEEGKKGITAEFNGIVSKADIKQGAAVTQGMELFTIQNTDKASVDVTLSKYDYDTVKEGQSAEITLGDNTYQGTVTKMSHIAVQNEKGTPVISATISINDPDDDIFLGVDAKVKIHAASAKNVVTLPVEVVNIGKDGSFCYVIEDGLVTKRDITTGISSEDYVEVIDGIKEGEEVISDLGDYTEGMEVQAVSEQTGEDADE